MLSGFAPFASAQEASQGAGAAEAKAFGLRLKGLDGKMYDIAQMRGEVVLVSFGATWCAPCAWELFALEELKEEYKGKPVRFLWVSIEDEKQTSNALLRHFTKTYKVSFPVLRDPSKEVFAQFTSITRIPLVVFFDKEGRFVAPVHRGMSNETIVYKQHMRRRLDALLNATTPSEATTGATGANRSTK
ncbi:MAG TPA: TlpA disulfide reductase family protein [Pyrinomonadaceae bacterium]